MTSTYKVKLKQNYLGEVCYNIFHYFSEEDWAPEQLALSFLARVVVAMQGVSHTANSYDSVEIEDARAGVLPPYVLALSDFNGIRVGDPTPSFNAWGYFLQRGSKNMRSGGKRVSGVNEADTAGQKPATFFENNLVTPADAFSAVLTWSATYTFLPLIYRKEKLDPPAPEQGTQIISAQYRRYTSQNTRKEGRGESAGTNLVPNMSVNGIAYVPPVEARYKTFQEWVDLGGVPFYIDGAQGKNPKVLPVA